jgi:hypothetical protein
MTIIFVIRFGPICCQCLPGGAAHPVADAIVGMAAFFTAMLIPTLPGSPSICDSSGVSLVRCPNHSFEDSSERSASRFRICPLLPCSSHAYSILVA